MQFSTVSVSQFTRRNKSDGEFRSLALCIIRVFCAIIIYHFSSKFAEVFVAFGAPILIEFAFVCFSIFIAIFRLCAFCIMHEI